MVTEVIIIAESTKGPQQRISDLHESCRKFGQKINVKAKVYTSVDYHSHETLVIKLGEVKLRQIDRCR